MSALVDRAMLLMDQGRADLALPELLRHLGSEPQDPFAHALVALCLSRQEKFSDATKHADDAVRLAPDMPFAHYVSASVLRSRNRFKEALPCVEEAIRLDPYNSQAFGLLAEIHLAEKRHEAALQAAERGLEVDAEDVTCQNLRAMALKNLGRHNDAADALRSALSKDPENSITHANQGWALLEKNKSEEALRHFQEALRLDPTNEWARDGIVTALKSRYFIYAWMLKYFLWMSKLSSRAQWGLILGLYFGSKMLSQAARANPEYAWFLIPVRALLFVFVILTWVADPLFNVALRLSKYGRLALSRDQTIASNVLLFFLGTALLALVMTFVTGPESLLILAMGAGFMVIPAAAVFKAPEKSSRRKVIAGIAVAMLLIGVFIFGSIVAMDDFGLKSEVLLGNVKLGTTLFILGLLATQIMANFSAIHHERR